MDRIVVSGKITERADLAQALGIALLQGARFEVVTSSEDGSAIDLAREAGEAGAERVIAAGGDGTIHEVVQGLMMLPREQRPVLGLLPCGTANDFAAQFELPHTALVDWLRFALAGEPVVIDVGLAGGIPFMNMATIGPPAEISAGTDHQLKQTIGKIAYTATALTRASATAPVDIELTGPGIEFQGEIAALCVCNGRQAGGGFVVAPDALLDDGVLEVLLVPRMGLAGLGVVAGGALLGGVDLDGRVQRYRVPWLEISGKEPLTVSLDGEVDNFQRLRFEVARQALRLAVPPARVIAAAEPESASALENGATVP